MFTRLTLCICFIVCSFLVSKGQNSEPLDSIVAYKSKAIQVKGDLVQHYDALYQLIKNHKTVDEEWFNVVFDKARSFKDSLNHPLFWANYVYYYQEEDYDKALVFANQYINYKEEYQYEINGDFYIEAGILYEYQSNDIKALAYFEQAELCYRRDSSENIVYALSAMGNLNEDVGYYEKAMYYQQEALALAKEMKSETAKYYNTTNKYLSIATLLEKNGNDYDLIVQHYKNAIRDGQKQRNQDLLLSAYAEYIAYLVKAKEFGMVDVLKQSADSLKAKNSSVLKSEFSRYYDLVISKYGLALQDYSLLTHPDTLLSATLSNEIKKEVLQYAHVYCAINGDYRQAAAYSMDKIALLEKESKNLRQSTVSLMTEREMIPQLKSSKQELERKLYTGSNIFYILIVFLIGLVLFQILLKRENNKVRELNKKIKTKNQTIQNHYDELERIAYVMTHDLKEPANTIYTFSRLIEKTASEDFTKETKNLFNIIMKTSNGMLKSVGVMHSYLIEGQTSILKEVSLDKLFNQAKTNLAGTISEKNAEVKHQELPLITCYPEQITKLFQSLLSNALKYSRVTHEPKISLNFHESADKFTFAMKDNGIGITKDSQEQIFNLFKRVHSDNDIEGSGIGLASCRKIVEMHQGEIWVESELNKGSVFYFTLSKSL